MDTDVLVHKPSETICDGQCDYRSLTTGKLIARVLERNISGCFHGKSTSCGTSGSGRERRDNDSVDRINLESGRRCINISNSVKSMFHRGGLPTLDIVHGHHSRRKHRRIILTRDTQHKDCCVSDSRDRVLHSETGTVGEGLSFSKIGKDRVRSTCSWKR